ALRRRVSRMRDSYLLAPALTWMTPVRVLPRVFYGAICGAWAIPEVGTPRLPSGALVPRSGSVGRFCQLRDRFEEFRRLSDEQPVLAERRCRAHRRALSLGRADDRHRGELPL